MRAFCFLKVRLERTQKVSPLPPSPSVVKVVHHNDFYLKHLFALAYRLRIGRIGYRLRFPLRKVHWVLRDLRHRIGLANLIVC